MNSPIKVDKTLFLGAKILFQHNVCRRSMNIKFPYNLYVVMVVFVDTSFNNNFTVSRSHKLENELNIPIRISFATQMVLLCHGFQSKQHVKFKVSLNFALYIRGTESH